MNCPNCGKFVGNSNFCPQCGAKIQVTQNLQNINPESSVRSSYMSDPVNRDNEYDLKSPFYKRWWFWPGVVVLFLIILVIGSSSANSQKSKPENETVSYSETTGEQKETEKEKTTESNKKETETTSGEKSLLLQLFEEYSNESADSDVPGEYTAALLKAKTYSDVLHMSKKGIYEQLTSEYGEQFDADAAQYAIDHLDADYKANALAKAKEYREELNMSKSAIYDQLISDYGEQFTAEEAQYAIDNLD